MWEIMALIWGNGLTTPCMYWRGRHKAQGGQNKEGITCFTKWKMCSKFILKMVSH